MGSCQSRSTAVAVAATNEGPKSSQHHYSDGRSARSGSLSGSQASESTVTISNTQQQQQHNHQQQQQLQSSPPVCEDDEMEGLSEGSGSSSGGHDGDDEAVDGEQFDRRAKNVIVPETNLNNMTGSGVKLDLIQIDSPEERVLKPIPTQTAAELEKMPSSDPVSDSQANVVTPIDNDPLESSHGLATEPKRRFFFPPKPPQVGGKNKPASRSTSSRNNPHPQEEVSFFADKGNSKTKKPRNRKGQQIGFLPIRSSIPEEEDPEMPSDEEDFCEDLVRNTPNDEPGRLVPIKLKTQPRTSVSSVAVAAGRNEGNRPPMLHLADEKSAVPIHTLSEFQRLKLQVKLQKHQEMKERRVQKVEDRLQDAESYRQLWNEYQKTEESLEKLDTDRNSARNSSSLQRTNSFDLRDSGSWFFDFSSPDAAIDPYIDGHDDNGSQASLSLLSEQSLDAQKRYYAEKRKRQKRKGKKNRNDGNEPLCQESACRSEGVPTIDTFARLTISNSITSGGASRDYGPIRDNFSTPLDVEVSFQNQQGGGPTDDAGSYVSDLGDESWAGGGMAGGSQTGNSFNPYNNPSSSSVGNNDYGVKRRIRKYSGYSQEDHQDIEAKLQALEHSLALMKQRNADEAGNEIDSSTNSTDPPGVQQITPESTEDMGVFLALRRPEEGLTPKQHFESFSPQRSRPGSKRPKGSRGKTTEKELAQQIEEAILEANTPTRTTRKSIPRKKKGSKTRQSTSDVGEVVVSYDANAYSCNQDSQIKCKNQVWQSPEPNSQGIVSSPFLPVPMSVMDYESPIVERKNEVVRDHSTRSVEVAVSSPSSSLQKVEAPAGKRMESQGTIASDGVNKKSQTFQVPDCLQFSSRHDTFKQHSPGGNAVEMHSDDVHRPDMLDAAESTVEEQDSGVSDCSEATGPRRPSDTTIDSELSCDRNDKVVIVMSENQKNFSVEIEEKKDDVQYDEQFSDLDESSRTSSVYDPIIASMSRDQYLRMPYGNPVANLVAFRQKRDNGVGENIPSDEEPNGNDAISSTEPTKAEDGLPNFWRDGLEGILLKNIFPERTNVVSDSPPPHAASVTPDTTPASKYVVSPNDSTISEDIFEFGRGNKSNNNFDCGLPDPDGRRLEPPASLHLDDQF